MDNPTFIDDEVVCKSYQQKQSLDDEKPRPRINLSALTYAGKDSAAQDAPQGPLKDGTEIQVNLQRKVGLIGGVSLIVGTMIGSGIFVSPKGVLERTGSPGLSLIVWAGCGLISMFGALSYAELGTLVGSSGAEYAYFLEFVGDKKKRKSSWWRPIPAFLFAWVSVFLLKPCSLAIICLASAEYLVRIFEVGCDTTAEPHISEIYSVKLFAAVILALIAFVNCYSVKLATKVQTLFTAAKLFAIVLIVIGGIVNLARGSYKDLTQGFHGSTTNLGNIATAFYSGLWAYDGWNNLNYVTEELKNPNTNLPRSIFIGIPLVTICYILVIISYLTAMTATELLATQTVAVLFGSRLLGIAGEVIMILSVAMSTFGAANGSCFTAGRLSFAASREGHLIDLLSFVHVRRRTPIPSLVFINIVGVFMILPASIESLIDFFSFTAWMFYAGTMGTLLVMRYNRKDDHRPYKVPIFIPIFVLVISVYLVIAPIVWAPQVEYLYAALFIVAGLFLYFPFVYMGMRVPGIDAITRLSQMIFEVLPTEEDLS